MAVHTTKCKIAKKEKSDRLYKAILTLETEEECYNFFQDLCTIPDAASGEQSGHGAGAAVGQAVSDAE